MGKVVTVRGRFSDPTHIELEQPVNDVTGPVEVVLRPLTPGELSGRRNLLGLCADLGAAPAASDIDELRQEISDSFPRDDI